MKTVLEVIFAWVDVRHEVGVHREVEPLDALRSHDALALRRLRCWVATLLQDGAQLRPCAPLGDVDAIRLLPVERERPVCARLRPVELALAAQDVSRWALLKGSTAVRPQHVRADGELPEAKANRPCAAVDVVGDVDPPSLVGLPHVGGVVGLVQMPRPILVDAADDASHPVLLVHARARDHREKDVLLEKALLWQQAQERQLTAALLVQTAARPEHVVRLQRTAHTTQQRAQDTPPAHAAPQRTSTSSQLNSRAPRASCASSGPAGRMRCG